MSALGDLARVLLDEKIQAAERWLEQNLTAKQQQKLGEILLDLVAGEEKDKEPSKKMDPTAGSTEETEQNG